MILLIHTTICSIIFITIIILLLILLLPFFVFSRLLLMMLFIVFNASGTVCCSGPIISTRNLAIIIPILFIWLLILIPIILERVGLLLLSSIGSLWSLALVLRRHFQIFHVLIEAVGKNVGLSSMCLNLITFLVSIYILTTVICMHGTITATFCTTSSTILRVTRLWKWWPGRSFTARVEHTLST